MKVSLSRDDVASIVADDPLAARFFVVDNRLKAAALVAGSLVEVDESGTERSDISPYLAVVVRGGEAECVPSTRIEATASAPVRCSVSIVINADTKQITRLAEVGTPLPADQ